MRDYGDPDVVLPRGTAVEARLGGGIHFFPGKVTRAPGEVANTDGTYAVQYKNGAWESNVARFLIRTVAGTSMNKADLRQNVQMVTTSKMKHDVTPQSLRERLMQVINAPLSDVLKVDPERDLERDLESTCVLILHTGNV